jgi:hypothetical protein
MDDRDGSSKLFTRPPDPQYLQAFRPDRAASTNRRWRRVRELLSVNPACLI